jgi:thiol-disulfide isomerase/thioredoxin
MKLLIIFILSILILSCNEQSKLKTYYLSENGKNKTDSLTREQGRKEAKSFFSKQSKIPFDSIYLDVTNLDTIIKKDSLIIVYQETYYMGKPSKEKIDNQRQWDNLVNSLMNKDFFNKDFKTIDDIVLNKTSLNHKPTLVNLWFTTCAPCITEMPSLNKLKEKYKNKVNFISITYNNKEEVQNFLKRRKFDFTHIINEEKFLNAKKITQYPINVFLDKNGNVKFVEGNISIIKNDDGTFSSDIVSFEHNINKLL